MDCRAPRLSAVFAFSVFAGRNPAPKDALVAQPSASLPSSRGSAASGADPLVRAGRHVGIALLALVALAYVRVFAFGHVGFDDEFYVFRNPDVLYGLSWERVRWAFTTFSFANWHPLTWLTYLAEVDLYGVDARGFHVTNVILHAGNALLFFLLLRETTGSLWLSALAAALFALHPLRVESVTWISERKDVLCAFFGLAALLTYTRYARRGRKADYAWTLALYALGLMSKATLVTWPFLMLLLDVWPLGRVAMPGERRGLRPGLPLPGLRLWVEKLPFFALSAASCTVTYLAQDSFNAVKPLILVPFDLRVANALVSCVAYLRKTVWPSDLAVFYPYPAGYPLWQPVAAALFLLAVSWLALRLLPRIPALGVGWFWFLGTLAPVIGLVTVGDQALADRYTYVPHLGLMVAVVWSGAALFRTRGGRFLAAGAAGMVILALTVATVHQNGFWRDTKTLFARAQVVTRNNDVAHIILSFVAMEEGNRAEFAHHYPRAVAISPLKVAYRHNMRGFFLARAGYLRQAKEDFVQALELEPRAWMALLNLGVVLAYEGRIDEGIGLLERASALAGPSKTIEHTLSEMSRVRDARRTARGTGA